jgi:hypothetical protein
MQQHSQNCPHARIPARRSIPPAQDPIKDAFSADPSISVKLVHPHDRAPDFADGGHHRRA